MSDLIMWESWSHLLWQQVAEIKISFYLRNVEINWFSTTTTTTTTFTTCIKINDFDILAVYRDKISVYDKHPRTGHNT